MELNVQILDLWLTEVWPHTELIVYTAYNMNTIVLRFVLFVVILLLMTGLALLV